MLPFVIKRHHVLDPTLMPLTKGKPLFEMCCYHMGIARKGGGV